MTAELLSDLEALPDSAVAGPSLHLFSGPYVCVDGHRRDVPEGSKRLLAFVALRRRRVQRRHVAGLLWPGGSDERAAGNLRSALWRLRGADIDLMDVDKCSLRLREDVTVDVELVGDWAARVISGRLRPDELSMMPSLMEALELLPGWYDDWVLLERERIRQRMLHGLEALSHQLVAVGRFAEAVEAAMVAVAVEPLRESAQRTLVAAHLAEGNQVEGRRCFDAYRAILRRDLGAEPAPELTALVHPRPVTAHRRHAWRPGTREVAVS
jgi:DNA-binding SARP family transcriptional activator